MSEFWMEIIGNRVLVSAFFAWLAAQILKTIIYVIVNKEFNSERLLGDGGMPSSHSATVMGLVTAVVYTYGASSSEFAIAFVFAVIVMHDAMGVRREAGKQAVAINNMLEYFEELGKKPVEVQLKEFVGHTPFQVMMGAILGVVVGIIVNGVL